MLIQNPHPISTTYLDEQTVRASSALPAAGDWDVSSSFKCPSFTACALQFNYTRGGVGGAFEVKIDVSRAATPTQWAQMTAYETGAVAAGSDTASAAQREGIVYESTSASLESITLQFRLDGVWENIRVSVRETGVVGNPGTLSINLSLA